MSHQLSKHSMRPDMSDRFGALRALLQQAPSQDVWGELCEELGLWGEDERERVALPYALDHLDRWPVEVVRWTWGESPGWRMRLASGWDVRGADELRALIAQGDAARVVALKLAQGGYEALRADLGRFERLACVELYVAERGEAVRLMGARWPATLRSLRVGLSDAQRGWGRRVAEAIAQNEALGGLEALTLCDVQLGDAGTSALAASPHLRSLRALDLSRCGVRRAGAAALADSAVLDSLVKLNLRGCSPGPGLVALVGSPRASALRALGLSGVSIDAACARALAAASWPPGLEELTLDVDRLGARALAALASAPGLRAVRHIWSSNGARSPARLLASPHLTGLRELELVGAHDEATWRAVAQNEALSGLEQLYIVEAPLTDAQLDALAASPLRPRLRSLYTDGVLGDVVSLFERAAWPALRELRVDGAHRGEDEEGAFVPTLSDEDAARLASSGVLAGLEVLALPFHGLSDVAALADSGMLGGLRVLELSSNHIEDAGLIALLERGGMDRLEALGIAHNRLGDVGAAALARSPHMRALKRHHARDFTAGGLRCNSIGGAGLLALASSPCIDAVEELDVSGNAPLTHEEIVALAALPGCWRLSGWQWSMAEGAREETWQALIDSPYVNEATRDSAAQWLASTRALRGPQT
jgi:hypothetical protein